MPLGRHLLLVFMLAIGCRSVADLGGRCPTLDGGPPASRAGSPDAGATGGGPSGDAAGSGGIAASGGASTAGAASGGSAGADASTVPSGSGGTVGSGGSSSSGGAGGSTASSGGADTGTGAAPGDAGPACGDYVRDGDETGIDCGGSCAPCQAAVPCSSNADCSQTRPGCEASQGGCVCDGPTLVCVPGHCADHRHDGDETDVDCGGSCRGCGPGSLCRTDADCGGVAVGCGDQCYCDTATSTCVYNDCYDNKTDALETDFDCGGPLCHPCDLGAKCLVDTDCVSAACDLVTHSCIAEQCEDHRTDGYESDVDCGGIVCPSCALGKKCHTTLDCPSGHVCNASKVCQ